MKENLIEYHPNGCLKHKISYYDNGSKNTEVFYDNLGRYHRNKNLPAEIGWYINERLYYKAYCRHGEYHNIYGPADMGFHENRKIKWKDYLLYDGVQESKLQWMNQIKNI